jgi:hypothetical protein
MNKQSYDQTEHASGSDSGPRVICLSHRRDFEASVPSAWLTFRGNIANATVQCFSRAVARVWHNPPLCIRENQIVLSPWEYDLCPRWPAAGWNQDSGRSRISGFILKVVNFGLESAIWSRHSARYLSPIETALASPPCTSGHLVQSPPLSFPLKSLLRRSSSSC